jgi:hypothetical protein
MNDDHRTLDQIKADDIGQLEDILKQAKEHWFNDVRHAMHFQGEMLFKELRRHGVTVREGMDWRLVDRQLNAQHVRVENRDYEQEEDKWREGIYIYKHDELIAWIQKIQAVKKSILNIYPEYLVKTNVKE